ncbi:hypothetical protein GE253_23340 [Niveispirillum sp. SYP-B3756]|uniref:JmjC domain-containing protein n=1 Tax=Niveispirillum sp. SYP-B3756 TaxID=2662178 RepID=UPI001291E757|nr:cupin domain-containing protein [Niveispirillum sp. SYP-B3756]MQP68258.1 hypothetical protein [Niveispirillum sp. SYP-B3756]
MIGGLRALIHPHDPADLDRAFVEEKRLHLRTGRSADFAALMPWTTFNGLLSSQRFATGQGRVVRNSQDLPADMYMVMRKADRVEPGGRKLEPAALQALCRQGVSIAFNSVNLDVPRIGALAAALERRYRVPIAVNGYATFERGNAFKPHWDSHDVLVLQIHGTKHWWCYGDHKQRHPVTSRVFDHVDELGPVEWEGTLQPGDILYVPNGDIHRTNVTQGASLHLTVALNRPRGQSFARWLAERLEEHEVGRQPIASFATPDARAHQQMDIGGLLRKVLENTSLDAFLADEDTVQQPYRPCNLGFSQDLETADWEVLPALRRHPSLPADGPADFMAGTVRVRLTAAECRVLSWLLARDGARLGDLRKEWSSLVQGGIIPVVSALADKSLVWLLPPMGD